MSWIPYILIGAVGVSLLPLLFDVLNTFLPIGRLANRNLSWLLVALLMLLSGSAIVIYATYFVPFHYERVSAQLGPAAVTGISIFAVWLWVNTNYTYFATVLWSFKGLAGPEEVASVRDHAACVTDGNVLVDSSRRWCERCQRAKNEHTHHCKICNRCIVHMDHHCPLTATCVSVAPDGNGDLFLLFLLYVTAGCTFIAVVCFEPFVSCFELHSAFPHREECSQLGALTLLFVPALLSLPPLFILLSFQLYLEWTRQTTLHLLRRFFEFSMGNLGLAALLTAPPVPSRPGPSIMHRWSVPALLFPFLHAQPPKHHAKQSR